MTERTGCPVHRDLPPSNQQKTSREALHSRPPVERDERGIYRIYGYAEAKEVLRSEQARQAGFHYDSVIGGLGLINPPVLYMEGDQHHDMRRQTARYFTPSAVAGYQDHIAQLANRQIARLHRQGEADLDDLTLELSVGVAAQVLGLTHSLLPGMSRRIERFIARSVESEPGAVLEPQTRWRDLQSKTNTLAFFMLDVKPAIRALRKTPGDNLISHLIGRGYSDTEILTECFTYSVAGMVTTREFMSAAAWHLLEHPELRWTYLHAPEAERHDLLREILRLEPVVGHLYRHLLGEVRIGDTTIPAGSTVALHIYSTNADPAVTADTAQQVCPARPLPRGVQPQLLAFGEGHHRCPGAYLAIRESDVFLRRLLMLSDLRLLKLPSVYWNETVKGYEVRGLRVSLQPGH
ncbi:MAG: cytochrome [Deinococcus sp.]|nr:cytochrome [Deinococcus sp.]